MQFIIIFYQPNQDNEGITNTIESRGRNLSTRHTPYTSPPCTRS